MTARGIPPCVSSTKRSAAIGTTYWHAWLRHCSSNGCLRTSRDHGEFIPARRPPHVEPSRGGPSPTSLQPKIHPRRRALILDPLCIKLRRDDEHTATIDLAVEVLLHALRTLLRELSQTRIIDGRMLSQRALHLILGQRLRETHKIARLLEVGILVGLRQ